MGEICQASAGRTKSLDRAPLFVAGCLAIACALSVIVVGETDGIGRPEAVLVVAGAISLWVATRASGHIIKKVNLAMLSAGLVVVMIELALRVVLPIPREGGGWARTPGVSLRLVSSPDQLESIHRFNMLGFRGPEIAVIPSEDHRVICIGDSFTEGIGANEDECWPSVLNDEVADLQAEAINLGVAGANIRRYMEILANVGIPLRPTHVVVCVNPPDFAKRIELPPDLKAGRKLTGPFHRRSNLYKTALARGLSGWTYLWDRVHGRWASRNGMYWQALDDGYEEDMMEYIRQIDGVSRPEARRRFRQRVEQVPPSCLQAVREGKYNSALIKFAVGGNLNWSFLCTVEDTRISPADLQARTRKWLRFYAETCRRFDAVPILLFFPNAGLVSDQPNGPIQDDSFVSRPDLSHDNSLSEILAPMCTELNIVFVDATPVLRERSNDASLYHRYDCHPTAEAYRIVGKLVAERIENQFLASP